LEEEEEPQPQQVYINKIVEKLLTSPKQHSIRILEFDCQKLYASSLDLGAGCLYGMSKKDSRLYAESPTMKKPRSFNHSLHSNNREYRRRVPAHSDFFITRGFGSHAAEVRHSHELK
jgi:hypothetical protein